jgi:hypothetical protein
MKQKRQLLILALIIIVSSGLNFSMLTRGQPWWDDFASYLMQAQAILKGDLQGFILHNTFSIANSSYPPGPVAYPWGYPLLLAPLVALFGLNTLVLKFLNVAFFAVFLASFYFLARTRLNAQPSLLLTALLAANPALLRASDQLISDIPFLAVSTLSLLLIETWGQKTSGWKTGLALGVSLFGACLLRTNGLLLLAPLAVSLTAHHWPDWKSALRRAWLPGLTFSGLFALSAWIFPNGQTSYLNHFSMLTVPRLLENALFYLWLPAGTFEGLPAASLYYPLLACFAILSLINHWKRDLALHTYSLLSLMLFITWPERQGLRFIYPLIPLLFLFAGNGLHLALRRVPAAWQWHASRSLIAASALLLLISLGISASIASQNLADARAINGPFDTVSYDLYEFIRTQTPAESIIIFMRPRALRLFTQRDSFLTTRCADLPKGDYVALHEKMAANNQIAPDQIAACPGIHLEMVFNNKRFSVYRIHPQP